MTFTDEARKAIPFLLRHQKKVITFLAALIVAAWKGCALLS